MKDAEDHWLKMSCWVNAFHLNAATLVAEYGPIEFDTRNAGRQCEIHIGRYCIHTFLDFESSHPETGLCGAIRVHGCELEEEVRALRTCRSASRLRLKQMCRRIIPESRHHAPRESRVHNEDSG